MTSYNKEEYKSIKHLIPLYVKGKLSDTERAKVERAIIEYQELKDEIEIWNAIDSAYKAIEEKLPQPSPSTYSKITQRIKEREQISFAERFSALLERFIPSRRLSFSIIVAQLLIIITLGIYVITLKAEYRTLSATSVITETPVKINVVFKENASEAEIRKLLTEINGKIIDGPYASGLYVIGITSKENLEEAINKLKKSGVVIMAERAY